MILHSLKDLIPRDDAPLRPAAIAVATFYCVAFTLFVVWRRFLS
jgi:hypothetical protein